MAFTVAIVGRPNVGKSTLFNRLVGRRAALVAPEPGVTRDRREGWARIGPLRFRAIDTAGLEEAAPETLAGRMMAQTARALEEADAALLLIDGRAGVTPADEFFADQLRRLHVPIVLAVNKCEGGAADGGIAESHALGLGQPIPISAEHGEGLADLYDALSPFDSEAEEGAAGADDVLRLAIVGRPNVGKSTLLNRLVGEGRVITGAEPGSRGIRSPFAGHTRAARSSWWIRRACGAVPRPQRRSTSSPRGTPSAPSGRRRWCSPCSTPPTPPAARTWPLRHAWRTKAGRSSSCSTSGTLVRDRGAARRKAVEDRLEGALAQVKGVPLVACSALTGAGAEKIMPAVQSAFETWNRRIPTAQLNRWLEGAVDHHPPPLVAGRRLKLRYITQVKARPPTFALFASKPTALPKSYRRYLVNGIGAEFGLAGVPIRLLLRAGKNPYAPN